MTSLKSCCRIKYNDLIIGIKPLAALDEIKLAWLAEDCSCMLSRMGLDEKNAAAVGHNAALVYLATDLGYQNPQCVLDCLSLNQIADIAKIVCDVQEGTLEGDVAV